MCLHVYVCTYVQYVLVYLCMCMCVLCVCSREISYCYKYIIIHKLLYTLAVLSDLRGRIKREFECFIEHNLTECFMGHTLISIKHSIAQSTIFSVQH